MYSKSLVPSVCVVVKSLTLAEAYDILEKVNPAHLTRMMAAGAYNLQTGQSDSLRFIDIGNDVSNLNAQLTSFRKMWHIAGPPHSRHWIEGSLCQYVADALLTEIFIQGEDRVSEAVSQIVAVGAP